ncbi:MAG: NAD(P)H-dependent oxidoreductase [Oscillospiraceae bacterium]|jgi:multimeric flavodoxin WrbA|nr:NAD(P)H-dependent oxidoreductase [Oscillospiraceae bacterium]
MKITVINGTEQRGCTFAMKEQLLASLGGGHTVTEYFLPRDCPIFCTGCKTCFYKDLSACPHAQYTVPIWESIMDAELLVFTSPTYVFHATAQMKALLDHYGKNWMAHSPQAPMFRKQAVIITNAIGQGMDKTVRDIKDSLDFWGVARTYVIKQALFQPQWEQVTKKRKAAIMARCEKTAARITSRKRVTPTVKIKALFTVMRIAQGMIDKSERRAGREHTADYLHWQKNGWLNGKKPWRE